MKKRSLKVRQAPRDYFLKGQGHKGNPVTSFILLKGHWLEQAGFTTDTLVSVIVNKNRLLVIPKE